MKIYYVVEQMIEVDDDLTEQQIDDIIGEIALDRNYTWSHDSGADVFC